MRDFDDALQVTAGGHIVKGATNGTKRRKAINDPYPRTRIRPPMIGDEQRVEKHYYIVKGDRFHPVKQQAFQRLRDMNLLMPVNGTDGLFYIRKGGNIAKQKTRHSADHDGQ